MQEKNGDNGERRENDRLKKIQQYRNYDRSPLANYTSDNYQVSFVIYFLFI